MNQEIINRGKSAQALLENETFKLVVAELKKEAFDTWTKTPPEAPQAREDLYYLYLSLGHIENKLLGMAQSAKIEEIKAAQAAGKQVTTET